MFKLFFHRIFFTARTILLPYGQQNQGKFPVERHPFLLVWGS